MSTLAPKPRTGARDRATLVRCAAGNGP